MRHKPQNGKMLIEVKQRSCWVDCRSYQYRQLAYIHLS